MTVETIEQTIREKAGVMLYFWGENCNVCHALRPKLFDAFDQHFPQIEKIAIDVAQSPEIAARFAVFSIPTGIVFLDGREFERISRNVSIPALVAKLSRPYSLLFG